MKPINFFSNPLIQIISFAIILINSTDFSGPFGYFVFFAAGRGYGYAITGMIGVIVTIVSTLLRGKRSINVQVVGLVFMCISFAWFVTQNTSREAMRDTLPFITLLLFVGVCAGVVTKAVEVHRRV